MTRRLRLAFAIGLCASAAMPVAAQTQTATVPLPVIGSTPEVCALQQVRLAPGAQVNFRGLSGNTLQIDQLTDARTLAANAASVRVQFDAVCNYPHAIRIESQNNGLWPTDGRTTINAPGFAYALPYTASLNWGETTGTLNANAVVRQIANQRFVANAPRAGEMFILINIEAGASNTRAAAPVLAGVYSDTIRIFLEPR